jgi:hypothetical protein
MKYASRPGRSGTVKPLRRTPKSGQSQAQKLSSTAKSAIPDGFMTLSIFSLMPMLSTCGAYESCWFSRVTDGTLPVVREHSMDA